MRIALVITSVLLFSACGASEQEDDFRRVRSAQSGMRVSATVDEAGAEDDDTDAALSGLQTSLDFSDMQTVEPVNPSKPGSTSPTDAVSEQTKLLEELIALLSTDVQDMLNRSRNRPDALQTYSDNLRQHIQRAEVTLRSLENDEDRLGDDDRRLTRFVRDLENDLEDAIAEGRSESATQLVKELERQQKELAEVQTNSAVVQRFARSFDDILVPLQERAEAIRANWDALVKGVHVTDVPGVEEIGVIKGEDGGLRFRRGRSRGRNRGGVFGGF